MALYSVYNNFLARLKDIIGNIPKARVTHREVDNQIHELFENPIVSENVSCKKGCSYCCYTQVSVTESEAELLAKCVTDGVEIDRSFLYIQGEAANSASDWYSIPYEMRKCVFLAEDNTCRVYEDRPSVCRTNYVFSTPEKCSTIDGSEKPIRLLSTPKADMTIMASYANSCENGALPYMLWKALRKNNS